jgi:hypothetical protein
MTPDRRAPTIAEQVDLIERTLHPEGRCVTCGGGKPYWKHGDEPHQHTFIAESVQAQEEHDCPIVGCDDGFTTDDALSWHMAQVHEMGPET